MIFSCFRFDDRPDRGVKSLRLQGQSGDTRPADDPLHETSGP
jgi:hypothetical protein